MLSIYLNYRLLLLPFALAYVIALMYAQTRGMALSSRNRCFLGGMNVVALVTAIGVFVTAVIFWRTFTMLNVGNIGGTSASSEGFARGFGINVEGFGFAPIVVLVFIGIAIECVVFYLLNNRALQQEINDPKRRLLVNLGIGSWVWVLLEPDRVHNPVRFLIIVLAVGTLAGWLLGKLNDQLFGRSPL